MLEQMVNLATGQPITDVPKLPHIENAQLTVAHLQACVENAKDGIVEIDIRILKNYQDQRLTIMGLADGKGALSTIEGRLGDFVNASLQQTPTTPQPKAQL